MSDDDRMDRAERIRSMRQGNRADDEPTTDGDDGGASPDQAGETDSDTETGVDADADGETGTDTDDGDDPTSEAGEPTAAVAEPTADETEPAASEDDETDTVERAGAQPDATAAAERAAAAAAQVVDDGSATSGAGEVRSGDVAATASPMRGPTGVELPDRQLLEEAMATGDGERVAGSARAAMEEEGGQKEEMVRVLEFALGEEHYCLDIEYVEEIVKRDAVTRVPNTPDYVEGVVDLRGQITTILDPKRMMDIDADGEKNLIVVFDPGMFEEQGAVGWVVDAVRQVVPVAESEVNDPPVDGEYVNGVVDREDHDQFVIWVEPDDALEEATSADD
ncbi:chemotaxis protein CheW [Haloarcula nitratireducens]|uniref:Chemotaxis protein CheW n=1 Tax=Haloarcula nitratireducens TaxID=2487749 RepID=A0AAW4PAF6_9EURY|nr:chemotaxis protein CheW [Halomicroarcula nitratireducens]MBX0294738.1 chemotaxis protein CheW [Halomicroarcula nitratireducens]